MQRQNKNSGHLERDYLNPFIDVSPPDGLIETLQRLNVTLARGQSEKDREGRELRRQKNQIIGTETKDGLPVNIQSLKHKLSSNRDRLIEQIPPGKKYRAVRKMAFLILEIGRVSNYRLAGCLGTRNDPIGSRVLIKRPSKKEYESKRGAYNKKIGHCFKTIRKFWKPLGYGVQRKINESSLVPLSEKNN